MKVNITKPEKQPVPFSKLSSGDVFWALGHYMGVFIKTEQASCFGLNVNCVNPENGLLSFVAGNTPVEPANVQIVLDKEEQDVKVRPQ